MTIKRINVGNVVNDGSGDDLRTAFVKVNDNFAELVDIHGEANTASNVGTGIGLFKEKVVSDLRFKSIVAGTGITVTGNSNTITIANNDDALINQINTQLTNLLNTYDFGNIGNQSNNVIEFILQSITTDFGSITSPGSISLDGGSLV
jgi:hypothetical protein